MYPEELTPEGEIALGEYCAHLEARGCAYVVEAMFQVRSGAEKGCRILWQDGPTEAGLRQSMRRSRRSRGQYPIYLERRLRVRSVLGLLVFSEFSGVGQMRREMHAWSKRDADEFPVLTRETETSLVLLEDLLELPGGEWRYRGALWPLEGEKVLAQGILRAVRTATERARLLT